MVSLVRQFDITAQPHQLMWLASQPHLAPQYLNFLTDICQKEAKQHSKMECEKANWRRLKVWVQYRSILKAQGFVYLRIDPDCGTVCLEHDGHLVEFAATFRIRAGQVTLRCDYHPKLPFVSWLIAKALDRTLRQVAAAMDRYAATLSSSPI
jgi:hypothetical protein